jgi:S-adenosylmethionine decarboxylase proenzyme
MDTNTNSYQAGGRHIICDMFKVNTNKLECITSNTYETFDKFIINTLVDAKINLLGQTTHHFGTPGSFTTLYLLAESHLSIHTWPEHAYIALDVFTCGESNTQWIVDQLVKYFEPESINCQVITRG